MRRTICIIIALLLLGGAAIAEMVTGSNGGSSGGSGTSSSLQFSTAIPISTSTPAPTAGQFCGIDGTGAFACFAVTGDSSCSSPSAGSISCTNTAMQKFPWASATPASAAFPIYSGTTWTPQALSQDVTVTTAGVATVGSTHLSAALPTNQGGTGVTAPSPANWQYFNTGTSATYSTPAGATGLIVWMAAGGGGGGAATSGGAAAHGGGAGGSGGFTEMFIPSPSGNYTYTVGAGGSAGTCSASPTASGTGGSTTFNGITVTGGGGGGTAGTTTDGGAGSAGSGAANQGNGPELIGNTNGLAGQAGGGGASANPGRTGGGFGGINATVTSGGVCNQAATNGASGWIVVEAVGAF